MNFQTRKALTSLYKTSLRSPLERKYEKLDELGGPFGVSIGFEQAPRRTGTSNPNVEQSTTKSNTGTPFRAATISREPCRTLPDRHQLHTGGRSLVQANLLVSETASPASFSGAATTAARGIDIVGEVARVHNLLWHNADALMLLLS